MFGRSLGLLFNVKIVEINKIKTWGYVTYEKRILLEIVCTSRTFKNLHCIALE